jgi:hypothetical protein
VRQAHKNKRKTAVWEFGQMNFFGFGLAFFFTRSRIF